MGTHGHAHGHGHGHAPSDADTQVLAEVLDLDAEVLHAHLAEVTGWVAGTVTSTPRHVVDLGAGTGAGTIALLHRFPAATVTAVDLSPDLLARLRTKATDLGLAGRVSTLEADLDAGFPSLDHVDLVWASASLHHLSDPDAVLAQVFSALRPGGSLAVLELEGFPRFLPDDLGTGTPGMEARVHDLLRAARAQDMPTMGSDWGSRLRAAGFTVVDREFPIDLSGDALPASTPRYVQASLRRVRGAMADRLAAEDLSTLDALLDDDGPGSLLRRTELVVRTVRSGWIATRP